MHNVLELHHDLAAGIYQHGGYHHFKISDPKPRDIHKASVRDRMVHHALYRQLYSFFDSTFINDSYSCRKEKGTHRAVNRFRSFAYQVSKNNTCTCWILKCDIRKFFASIDHRVLMEIISVYIPDIRTRALIANIVSSFCATPGVAQIGLPLGNLTSQLLVNIYMNEFDQLAKHKLKAKHYIRYADDFVILSVNKKYLVKILPRIKTFLRNRLKLEMHPDKISIETLASGIDFLGWVHFPNHRVLRTSTKKRMFRRIEEMNKKLETISSYLGLLTHGNAHHLMTEIQRIKCLVYYMHMLYTGTGDDGKTKLFCDQQRISKSSEVPEALGALDELQAFLGLVKVKSEKESRVANALHEVQENLFIIQAEVAGAEKKIGAGAVEEMEKIIGEIEKEIPPITGFTSAGGTELSALLDVARTFTRRAERALIAAKDAEACNLSSETLAYMNRLSSLLFALARLANHLAGASEEHPRY